MKDCSWGSGRGVTPTLISLSIVRLPCPLPTLQGAMVMEDEIDAQPDGSIVSRKAPMPLVDLRLARIQHTCGPRDLSSLMLPAVDEVVSHQASFPSHLLPLHFHHSPLLLQSPPSPMAVISLSSTLFLSPYLSLFHHLSLSLFHPVSLPPTPLTSLFSPFLSLPPTYIPPCPRSKVLSEGLKGVLSAVFQVLLPQMEQLMQFGERLDNL